MQKTLHDPIYIYVYIYVYFFFLEHVYYATKFLVFWYIRRCRISIIDSCCGCPDKKRPTVSGLDLGPFFFEVPFRVAPFVCLPFCHVSHQSLGKGSLPRPTRPDRL